MALQDEGLSYQVASVLFFLVGHSHIFVAPKESPRKILFFFVFGKTRVGMEKKKMQKEMMSEVKKKQVACFRP